MIGDSWQLRKYSLLGHWAVHCVKPPYILAHKQCKGAGEVGGGGEVRMSEQEQEEWGCWPKTSAHADFERNIYN